MKISKISWLRSGNVSAIEHQHNYKTCWIIWAAWFLHYWWLSICKARNLIISFDELIKASNSQSWVNKNYKNTKAQNALFSTHNKTVMSQCHTDNTHACACPRHAPPTHTNVHVYGIRFCQWKTIKKLKLKLCICVWTVAVVAGFSTLLLATFVSKTWF